ncbi:hypothetical protein ACRAWF_16780 [Streptomyces sp. L7]
MTALLAQRRWSAPVAGAVLAGVTYRIGRRLGDTRDRHRLAARLTGNGALAALAQTSALLNRHWWPLTVVGCVASRKSASSGGGGRAGRHRPGIPTGPGRTGPGPLRPRPSPRRPRLRGRCLAVRPQGTLHHRAAASHHPLIHSPGQRKSASRGSVPEMTLGPSRRVCAALARYQPAGGVRRDARSGRPCRGTRARTGRTRRTERETGQVERPYRRTAPLRGGDPASAAQGVRRLRRPPP